MKPQLQPWTHLTPSSWFHRYPGLTVVYLAQQGYGWIASNFVVDADHPLRESLTDRWQSRNRESLWWEVTTKKAEVPKATVRRWLARRTRHAFLGALKDAGLDETGNALALGAPNTKRIIPLRGQLRLIMGDNTIDTNFESLQKSCASLVTELRSRYGTSLSDRPSQRDPPDHLNSKSPKLGQPRKHAISPKGASRDKLDPRQRPRYTQR